MSMGKVGNDSVAVSRLPGVHLSLRDELEYSASMLREMVQMAQVRHDNTRSYFLQMAYLETCDRLRAIHSAQSTAVGALSDVA